MSNAQHLPTEGRGSSHIHRTTPQTSSASHGTLTCLNISSGLVAVKWAPPGMGASTIAHTRPSLEAFLTITVINSALLGV